MYNGEEAHEATQKKQICFWRWSQGEINHLLAAVAIVRVGLAGLFKDLPVAAVPKDLPGASPVGVGVILDALVSMIGSSRGVLE